ncbi:hypothetical protein HMPREF3181_00865 [Parvimonas sp. KA00067]|nr:hypothetical protein HMPREF3181_00865 [Parvimonas sp. KA00067]
MYVIALHILPYFLYLVKILRTDLKESIFQQKKPSFLTAIF